VAALSKEGILLLQRGDLEQGVKRLMQAAKEAPRNPRVLMNTAWSIMRLVEQQNEHAKMLIDAKRMLDDAAHLQPDHPRLAGLQTSMRNTESKIAAKRMQELYGNNQQPIQSGFPT
jgi:Flp pilus assembly protein TadD